jgi:hypothetical protein
MTFPGIDQFEKFKWGPGVIGRTAPIVVVTVVMLSFLAWLIPITEVRIAIAVGIVGLAVFFLVKSFSFAERNPSISVLEGAEATGYKRLEMAAKGFSPHDLPPVMKEITPPPQSLSNKEADDE